MDFLIPGNMHSASYQPAWLAPRTPAVESSVALPGGNLLMKSRVSLWETRESTLHYALKKISRGLGVYSWWLMSNTLTRSEKLCMNVVHQSDELEPYSVLQQLVGAYRW
jgi:hypothetical protein